jgi:hypothetical protein
VANSPLRFIDPFGLEENLLPETDLDSCLQNCLTRRNKCPGFLHAVGQEGGWHAFFVGGAAVSTLLAPATGGWSLIATGVFGLGEAYELKRAADEADELARLARADFAVCVHWCGEKWANGEDGWKDVYDFWDVYGNPRVAPR